MSGFAGKPSGDPFPAGRRADDDDGQDGQLFQMPEDGASTQATGVWDMELPLASNWGDIGDQGTSTMPWTTDTTMGTTPQYGTLPADAEASFHGAPFQDISNPSYPQTQSQEPPQNILTHQQWATGYQDLVSGGGSWQNQTIADNHNHPGIPFETPFASSGTPRPQQEAEPPRRKRGRPRFDLNAIGATATGSGLSSPISASRPASSGSRRKLMSGTSDDPERQLIRSRNRAAATRYRNKIQAITDRLEAEEREVSSQRQTLITYASQLREEVYNLKTEVLQHSSCGDPLIQGYLSTATQQAYATLASSDPTWTAGSSSNTDMDKESSVNEEQKQTRSLGGVDLNDDVGYDERNQD